MAWLVSLSVWPVTDLNSLERVMNFHLYFEEIGPTQVG